MSFVSLSSLSTQQPLSGNSLPTPTSTSSLTGHLQTSPDLPEGFRALPEVGFMPLLNMGFDPPQSEIVPEAPLGLITLPGAQNGQEFAGFRIQEGAFEALPPLGIESWTENPEGNNETAPDQNGSPGNVGGAPNRFLGSGSPESLGPPEPFG